MKTSNGISTIRLPLLGLLALALLLGGCGLIPAQELTDPLHLDAARVDVSFPAAGAALTPAVVSGSGSSTVVQFNNDDINTPVGPSRLEVPAGFTPTATLVASSGPATITLSNIVLTVRLWEGATDYDSAAADARVEVSATFNGSLTLLQGTCGVTCPYTFQDPSLAADGLELVLQGSDLSTALSILTDGAQPNFVQAFVTLEASGNPSDPQGVMTFELEAPVGSVSF